MSVFFPDGVQSLGKDTWTWCVAISVKTAATAAELNAASAVNIQLALRPGFGLEADTPKIDDRRLGSNVTYESFGPTKRTFGDATFIDRPQTAPADATRKHIDTITVGAVGFLVNRRGIGSAVENWVTWTAAQRYWLVPATAGPQTPIAAPAEGGQFEYNQSFIATGDIVYGVVT